MRAVSLILILGFSLVVPLRAQDNETPSCLDARTQTDMNVCAGRAFQKQDSLLNQVYPRVIARLGTDTARVRLLREAQRLWVRFRDAECGFVGAEVQGGSMQPMMERYCLASATQQRVEQLRQALPEADQKADARYAVTETANRLFAAMEERDTAALRTLMHPRAQIVSVASTGVAVRSADEWIRGLGRTTDALVERMWDADVEIDGDMATLWAPYDFHLGERFSHCGTDAFQFVREGGAWKMISITFTRRTAGCEGAP
jgi:uncharacterized protein YecT (DUF1311 family)